MSLFSEDTFFITDAQYMPVFQAVQYSAGWEVTLCKAEDLPICLCSYSYFALQAILFRTGLSAEQNATQIREVKSGSNGILSLIVSFKLSNTAFHMRLWADSTNASEDVSIWSCNTVPLLLRSEFIFFSLFIDAW